jgi:small subunit ribosomal protein S4
MARYTGSKNRLARRFGANVFGKARNPLLHKANPPGMHGAKKKKKSDYGVQLEEKQKLKASFGLISDHHLHRCYVEAARKHKNTPEVMMQMLECRLDMLVYRLNFATTIFAAHQLVSHGHILVDGKRTTIRSYRVRPGQTIAICEKSKKMKNIQEGYHNSNRTVPAYLESIADAMTGKLLSLPSMDSISLPLQVNIPMVCDFLAHKG